MKHKLLLLLAFFNFSISSCKTSEPTLEYKPQTVGVDEEFKPYLQDFINRMEAHGHSHYDLEKLSINFKQLKSPVVGTCYRFYDGNREILLDEVYWSQLSPYRKQALFYHEAVHCLCNRNHTFEDKEYKSMLNIFNPDENFGLFDDGCPKTIMYPEMLTNQCLVDRWQYYLEEMFEGCSK